MAAAQSVCARESDDFLVVKTLDKILVWLADEEGCFGRGVPHAVEDIPEVVRALTGIGKTTIGGSLSFGTINAAGAPGDLGAAHFLPKINAIHISEFH